MPYKERPFFYFPVSRLPFPGVRGLRKSINYYVTLVIASTARDSRSSCSMPATLPAFLGPLLSYLSDVLPPPLYSFLIDVLSHCLAFITALLTLLSSFLSIHPSQWDAQTVLPPLITVIAAYLGLIAFYRTTSWMFRTTIWFIKWGTILGVLAAGAGWIAGHFGSSVGPYGVVSELGRFLFGTITRSVENGSGSSRSRSQRNNAGSSHKKPKSWESFQRHREWRSQKRREGRAQDPDARELMNDIFNAAGRVLKESGWWGILGQGTSEGGSQKPVNRKDPPGKSTAGKSRSR